MTPQAYVFIAKFGDSDQTSALVEYLDLNTPYTCSVNEGGTVVVELSLDTIGAFFTFAAGDEKLNWIEYGVQLGG